ncbi:MAG: hypothetical protein IT458_07325 [Planctomycetes bacterium]|nr:hypothetical protein [Planctomycetota bacterium]
MKPLLFAAICLALPHACVRDDAPTPADSAPRTADARVRLRLSGAMLGNLEPCGCASNQLGGLARRGFKVREDRDYDLLLEGGNLTGSGSLLDMEKTYSALTVFDLLEYRGLALATNDLLLPFEDLMQYLSGFRVPAVASDLSLKGPGEWPVKPHLEFRLEGATVRVASLAMALPELGPGQDKAAAARVSVIQPQTAWQRAMAGAAKETFKVLFVHAPPEQIRPLARLEPRPDLLVGITEAVPEPPREAERASGVPLVFPGSRGRHLLDVWLARGPEGTVVTRYRDLRLEGSQTVPGAMEDHAVREVLAAHRQTVAESGVLEKMANLRPTATGASYAGSAACAGCHTTAYQIWTKTRHGIAWNTLESAERGELKDKAGKPRYGWPVTRYPDCVGCHTVGYGWKSGFVTAKQTPHLTHVGCESCHGPGSEHILARTAKQPAENGRMGRADVASCLHCHNSEQTPAFEYKQYWQRIEHGLEPK